MPTFCVQGYASLIWRPEFDAAETRGAPPCTAGTRALRMRSRINRGTPERPGLVLRWWPAAPAAAWSTASARSRAERELERLWLREMPTGVYDPRWLPCRTPAGPVRALASRWTARSPVAHWRHPRRRDAGILRHARVGRYGSTLDYLLETAAAALRERGIRDREIERAWSGSRAAGRRGALRTPLSRCARHGAALLGELHRPRDRPRCRRRSARRDRPPRRRSPGSAPPGGARLVAAQRHQLGIELAESR